MTTLPFSSKRSRIVIGLIALLGLLTWWVDRSRDHDHGEAPPRSYVTAARNALREIRVAQELYSAQHDGRYAAALAQLEGISTELDRRLAPSTGVVASVTGDDADGSWYEAEAGHRELPGWRCRFATDGSPAVSAGELTAGEDVCDPLPSDGGSLTR